MESDPDFSGSKAISTLASAAASQLVAMICDVNRDKKHQTNTADAADTNHGKTAGDGPLAKGLSQGSVMSRAAARGSIWWPGVAVCGVGSAPGPESLLFKVVCQL